MSKSPSGLFDAADATSRDHGPWSEETVRTLTRLWQEGDFSASQIGLRLGVTRNAVLGKVHRLGLSSTRPRVVRTPRPAGPPRRRQPPRPKQRTICSGPRHPARSDGQAPTIDPAPLASVVDPALAIGLVPRLEDLALDACHWPCGDPQAAGFAFCGRWAGNGPYCAGHAAVAYRPGGACSAAQLLRMALRVGA